jgi:hypothetical protein
MKKSCYDMHFRQEVAFDNIGMEKCVRWDAERGEEVMDLMVKTAACAMRDKRVGREDATEAES